jgi:uncharacterized ubiquitin-like protein YukD
MQSAIVSVKWYRHDRSYDLEVPATVPSQKLAELIAHNLRLDRPAKGSLAIRCIRPKQQQRLLHDTESLADVGLWDGVHLEIGPANQLQASNWDRVLDTLQLTWEPIEEQGAPPAPPLSPDEPAAPTERKVSSDFEFVSLFADDEPATPRRAPAQAPDKQQPPSSIDFEPL